MIALGPASAKGESQPKADAPLEHAHGGGQGGRTVSAEDLGEFAKDEVQKEEAAEEPKTAAKKTPAKGRSASGGKSHQDPEVPPEDIPF